jgi:Tol biopolymer transport system component
MKRILVFLVCFPLVTGFTFGQEKQSDQLLSNAIYQEEVKGNLEGAILIYKDIIKKYPGQRAIAAEALFHLGLSNEKLGNKIAKEYYEQLVSNYGDQPEFVRIARERLARLTTSKSTNEISVRQVWNDGKIDNCGSVSADGEYLSFTDWGSAELAVRNLKTGENKQLTTEGTWIDSIQFVAYSLISPDGKQVAYSWYKDRGDKGEYELRLIKVDNQKPVILYYFSKDEEIKPSLWFSNGKKIIVQKYNNKSKIWQLSSVNLINGEVQLLILKEKVPIRSLPINLSLSPDEKYIAFDFPNLSDLGIFDIILLSVDTKAELPLIEHPANDRLLGWLPGRNELLFTSDRSGTTDVWAVNTSGKKPFDDPKCILTNIGDIYPMGFTRDGSLYFSIVNFLYESFIVPFDNDSGKLSKTPRTLLSGLVTDVCWLPDGESLICIQHILEPDKSWSNMLYLLDRRTGEARALASNLNIEGQFRLSPDGKSVLVLGRDKRKPGDKDAIKGIYAIDLTTGLPVEIKVKNDLTLSWSVEWDKEGINIFYPTINQIVKHNIESGEEMILYNGKRLNVPILTRSSDGNSLIFDDLAGIEEEGLSVCQLLKIPDTGGEAKIMCSYNNYGNWRFKRFALSPDGKYIYFSALDSALKSIIYRIPAAGGIPDITWQQPKDFFFSGISIHPEGKQIALSVSKPGIEIRVIENLGRKVADIFSGDK